MSYRSSFDQLHYVDHHPECLPSTGAFALLSLAQLEEFEAERIPGDHDAHVCAWIVDRASCLVESALTNFCPPPVVNDVAPVVTTPVMSGQGVGTPSASLASRKAKPRPARKARPSTKVQMTLDLVVDMGSVVSRVRRRTSSLCPVVAAPLPVPAVGSAESLLAPCIPLFGASTVQVAR